MLFRKKCTRHKVNINNFHPDCLNIEVYAEIPEAPQGNAKIYLSLSFFEQEHILAGGFPVVFSLRAGVLRIIFNNAGMALKDRRLCGELVRSRTEEVSSESASEQQFTLGYSSGTKAGAKHATKDTKKSAAIFNTISCSGSADKPAWVFRSLDPLKTPLLGTIQEEELGQFPSIRRIGKPFYPLNLCQRIFSFAALVQFGLQ